MDIRDKSSLRQSNIKRFTLHATTAAILALNAETANAVSCPAEIVGTSLAGIICDFNMGSSVTVEAGGTAGGIAMTSYHPSLSEVTVAAGSIVNSTSTAISINASSLSNGLVNSGTLTAVNAGIAIFSSSTIGGGISNHGTISSGLGQAGIGVNNHSIVNDGIANTGTIEAGGSGIVITGSSTINGNISNSGMISGSIDDGGLTIDSHSRVNGNLSNSGTIHASGSGNAISILESNFNGSLSNRGTISSADNSGIRINNSATLSGTISNSGLISGGLNGISIGNDSAVDALLNAGTISGAESGLVVYSQSTLNSLSNNGTISGGSLTGIRVTSTATISGGISNSGIIQGGTNAINIDSASNVSHIDILGQSARMIGAVSAVNTSVNITSGTTFTSEGTYDVNSLNITENATFNMNNAITVQNGVNNSGTLAVANDSLQTILGNYTQNTGGVFQTEIQNTESYGQLNVTGAIDLSQSGNIYVKINNNASIHAGGVFNNIISGTTLTAPANGVQVSDNSFIWKFIADTTNRINFTAAIDSTAYDACQGSYCKSAANTIIGQVAAGNSVFSPYAILETESDFKAAASQATPQLTNENIEVIRLITDSVTESIPMWSMLQGRAPLEGAPYHSGKIWLKPYGATMVQEESNSVQGFNASAYGLVVGKDIQIKENWLFGGALAAGGDNMRGKSLLSGQSIYSNAFQGMLYGARKFSHHLYLAGQGLIGYGNNNTKRSIPLYATTAQGSYNSWFTNLRAQLGWNFYPSNQNLILTPKIDASYLLVNQRGYQESGSPMDLSVGSNNNSSLVLGVSGHGVYHLMTLANQQGVMLTGYAGIAQNVLNSTPQTPAAFVAGGPYFETYGVQFHQTVFRGGIGILFENPAKPYRLSLNYDLQTGNSAYSGIGSLTVTYLT